MFTIGYLIDKKQHSERKHLMEFIESCSTIASTLTYMMRYLTKEHVSRSQSPYELGGVQERYYFLLTAMLLNKEMTKDSLCPLLNRYETGQTSEKTKLARIRHLTDTLTGKIIIGDGTEFPAPLRVIAKGYLQNANTYAITKGGIDYLKFLTSSLPFPEDMPRLSEEEIDRHYDRLLHTVRATKGSIHDHTLFTMSVYAELLALNCDKNISGPYREYGYCDDYNGRPGSRSSAYVIPDISFIYSTPAAPVMIEADLGTERICGDGSSLSEKTRKHFMYAMERMSRYYDFPTLVIFVRGKNANDRRPKIRKTDPSYDRPLTVDDIAFIRENREAIVTASEFMAYAAASDYAKIEGTDLNEVRKEFFSVWTHQPLPDDRRTFYHKYLTAMDNILSSCSSQGYGEALTVGGMNRLIGGILQTDAEVDDAMRRDQTHLKHQKIRSTQAKLYDGIMMKDKWFNLSQLLLGHGVSYLPYSQLTAALKSLIPWLYSKESVRSVLRYAGLNEKWSRFLPARPLLKTSDGEWVANLRNCFISDGVKVFFEDVSYDLGGLVRLKEYLSMPNDIVKDCLLICIIDDDGMLANGAYLADADIYSGPDGSDDTDNDRMTYIDRFEEAYGDTDELPLKYRLYNDLAFIKRSDFLEKRPRLFLKLKKKVDVIRIPAAAVDARMLTWKKGGAIHGTRAAVEDFSNYYL